MNIPTNTENISKYPAEFGKALCEELELWCLGNWNFSCDNGFCSFCNLVNYLDMNAVFEAQQAVIAKVGEDAYINSLIGVCAVKPYSSFSRDWLPQTVLSNAVQRLCACLLALGIREVEVEDDLRLICSDCETKFTNWSESRCAGCGVRYTPTEANEKCPECDCDDYDEMCPNCNDGVLWYEDEVEVEI